MGIPIVALTGFLIGLMWQASRIGSMRGLVAYSIIAPAVLFASFQYAFSQAHFLGSIVIAVGLLILSPLTTARLVAAWRHATSGRRLLATAGALGAVVLVLAPAIVAGKQQRDATDRELEKRTLLERDAVRSIVQRREVHGYRSGRPERVFLDYWASIQSGEPRVLASFHPGLRDFVGEPHLAGALKSRVSYFASVEPRIFETGREGASDERTIRYTFEDAKGRLTAHSVTLARIRGRWVIIYSSQLNETLSRYAQAITQKRIAPGARKTAPEAVRAGEEAAQLQDRSLAKLGRERGR